MHFEPQEKQQLETGWKVVFIIWCAMFAALAMYLVVGLVLQEHWLAVISEDFPLDILRQVFFALSLLTIAGVYYLRKHLLKPGGPVVKTSSRNVSQHPAVAKYQVAVVITAALLESIGVFGLVLFLLAKDNASLYQLLVISAVAMLYFRPRKQELLQLAWQLKKSAR